MFLCLFINYIFRILAEEKFKDVIDDFINSENISLSFSPELSAFERRIVHEVSNNFIHIIFVCKN